MNTNIHSDIDRQTYMDTNTTEIHRYTQVHRPADTIHTGPSIPKDTQTQV
jgi:hypothetical protein